MQEEPAAERRATLLGRVHGRSSARTKIFSTGGRDPGPQHLDSVLDLESRATIPPLSVR